MLVGMQICCVLHETALLVPLCLEEGDQHALLYTLYLCMQHPFQIVGMDIMDLPKTNSGNCHILVFQDYLMKWLLVFPIPDQKSIRIAQILAEEVVPFLESPRLCSLTVGKISCLI